MSRVKTPELSFRKIKQINPTAAEIIPRDTELYKKFHIIKRNSVVDYIAKRYNLIPEFR